MKLEKYRDGDKEDLIQFISSHTWPYHGKSNPDRASTEESINNGAFANDDVETLWIIDGENKIGFFRLFDLQDETPLFDIRIDPSIQGHGKGTEALDLLNSYVFSELQGKRRLEGYTRIDNLPMRRVFEKCLFLKEAHHRDSWPDEKGHYYDSIGYTITKSDWKSGKITPFDWDD